MTVTYLGHYSPAAEDTTFCGTPTHRRITHPLLNTQVNVSRRESHCIKATAVEPSHVITLQLVTVKW